MRQALLIISALGCTLFGSVLAIAFLKPIAIEWAAREVVRTEVERRVGAKIDSMTNSSIVGLAEKALGKVDIDLERAKQALKDDVPRKTAELIANMLNADCECRKRIVEATTRDHETRIVALSQIREKLASSIEAAYASVTNSLMRELRIFAAANALAFLALGIVTNVRRAAALQIVLPAIVLLSSAAITAFLYIFNQNWLHTLVFSDYVGLWYFAYLSVSAVFLADVVMNRARVTTKLVNVGLQAVGSALQAVPC